MDAGKEKGMLDCCVRRIEIRMETWVEDEYVLPQP